MAIEHSHQVLPGREGVEKLTPESIPSVVGHHAVLSQAGSNLNTRHVPMRPGRVSDPLRSSSSREEQRRNGAFSSSSCFDRRTNLFAAERLTARRSNARASAVAETRRKGVRQREPLLDICCDNQHRSTAFDARLVVSASSLEGPQRNLLDAQAPYLASKCVSVEIDRICF